MPRSKALPAAGYTIRRYVKYLFQNAEGPLAVCPARSSRRQEGVLLQGHPRPWPVAKLRTLRVPAHKVQHRGNVVKLQGAVARPGCRRCASGLPPPALRSRQRSRPRSRCARGRLPCPPLPCWVVPPSKASSPVGRASSLLLSPLQGKPPRGRLELSPARYPSSLCKFRCAALAEAPGRPEGSRPLRFRLLAQRKSDGP